jgi:hypothetical protein
MLTRPLPMTEGAWGLTGARSRTSVGAQETLEAVDWEGAEQREEAVARQVAAAQREEAVARQVSAVGRPAAARQAAVAPLEAALAR